MNVVSDPDVAVITPDDLAEVWISTSQGAMQTCQVGYKNCSKEVWWLAHADCPRCAHRPPDGTYLLCVSCHSTIINGAPMQHTACGYQGQALDFFHQFIPF